LREAQEEIKRNKEIIDNLFIQKVQLFKELTKLNNKLEEDKKRPVLTKKTREELGKEIVNLFGYSIGQNNLEIKLVQEEQKAISAFFLNELTTLQAGNQPSEEFGASSQASNKKVFPFNPSLAEEIEKKSELIRLMIEEASKEKLLPNDLKNEKELEEKVKKNLTPLEKKDLLIAELQLKDKENKREKDSLFQGHASELEELKQENEQLKKKQSLFIRKTCSVS